MKANSPADILVELEDAVAACPPDRCTRILSGILRLLTSRGDRPQELLAHVTDGVLLRLMERVEAGALIQLSTALADLEIAPPKTVRRLASHPDPTVACPVLLRSRSLSTRGMRMYNSYRTASPHFRQFGNTSSTSKRTMCDRRCPRCVTV